MHIYLHLGTHSEDITTTHNHHAATAIYLYCSTASHTTRLYTENVKAHVLPRDRQPGQE